MINNFQYTFLHSQNSQAETAYYVFPQKKMTLLGVQISFHDKLNQHNNMYITHISNF